MSRAYRPGDSRKPPKPLPRPEQAKDRGLRGVKAPPRSGRNGEISGNVEARQRPTFPDHHGGPGALAEGAEDILHDAAVAVVIGFAWRVDPHRRGEVLVAGGHRDLVRNTAFVDLGDALDAEDLLAGEAEGL